MKKLLLLVLIGLISINTYSIERDKDGTTLKEGDIVFQMSKSKQSPLIQLATFSPWSHCGIIIYKNEKPYVLEASNIVKLTPLNVWLQKGRGNIWKQVRVLKNCPKISYKKYLGQHYDLAFKFNNNKMYCSELVYIIYKEQFGIELCKLRKISSYHFTYFLKKMMEKRNMNVNQYVVAPSDLLTYKDFESIYNL
jgi:hypothetical protein